MPGLGSTWTDPFTSDFAQSFWSNLLASLLIALLVFVVIEWRYRLRQERKGREEMSRDVLTTIWDELIYNQNQAWSMLTHYRSGGFPFPMFETGGWTLLSQAQVFTVVEPQTMEALVKVYNRFRSANELYTTVTDLNFGSAAAINFMAIESMPEEQRQKPRDQFNEHRHLAAERLAERVRELQPSLETALERVRAELGGP
jgi:hypothetical protein